MDLPRHHPPGQADGEPEPQAQRNFTDPDSRIMVRDGGFVHADDVRLAVDDANQIIVAEAVGNQAPDAEYFVPMLWRVVINCGEVPERATAARWWDIVLVALSAPGRASDVGSAPT